MSEYIEREAIMKEIAEIGGHLYSDWETAGVINLVCRQPAADVAPVVHGRWTDRQYKIACSVCNGTVYLGTDDEGVRKAEKEIFKYCPNCGARMDGGD